MALQCSGALPAETLGVNAPEKQRRTIRRPISSETGAPWVPACAAVASVPGGGGWIPVPSQGRRSTRVFAGGGRVRVRGLNLGLGITNHGTHNTARTLSEYRHHGPHRCR